MTLGGRGGYNLDVCVPSTLQVGALWLGRSGDPKTWSAWGWGPFETEKARASLLLARPDLAQKGGPPCDINTVVSPAMWHSTPLLLCTLFEADGAGAGCAAGTLAVFYLISLLPSWQYLNINACL